MPKTKKQKQKQDFDALFASRTAVADPEEEQARRFQQWKESAPGRSALDVLESIPEMKTHHDPYEAGAEVQSSPVPVPLPWEGVPQVGTRRHALASHPDFRNPGDPVASGTQAMARSTEQANLTAGTDALRRKFDVLTNTPTKEASMIRKMKRSPFVGQYFKANVARGMTEREAALSLWQIHLDSATFIETEAFIPHHTERVGAIERQSGLRAGQSRLDSYSRAAQPRPGAPPGIGAAIAAPFLAPFVMMKKYADTQRMDKQLEFLASMHDRPLRPADVDENTVGQIAMEPEVRDRLYRDGIISEAFYRTTGGQ